MIVVILKAIVGWLIFMLIGTNLLGVIVRGLFQTPKKELNVEGQLFDNNIDKQVRIYTIFSYVFLFVTLGYFYILYHFWNIGVMISAAMVMFSRLPDLIYEIKTGTKIKFGSMPKRPIDYFTTFILWAALPVLWYSFLQINN